MGLDAGVTPAPGLIYANLSINYSAATLKDAKGNSIPVQGEYSFWAIENILYYVPSFKVLGGTLSFQALLPIGTGSFTLPAFGVNAGGAGYADTWIRPATLGWNFKRASTWVGY
ncbi:MAG TPA: transporter, partial [Terriglobales bacterium]